MNARELNNCKNIIQTKRKELFVNIKNQDEYFNGNEMRINYYGSHMADRGTDTMQNELKNYFTHRQLEYLQNLDLAMDRINKGVYGVCVVCGKEISIKRLEVVPHTNYCIPCKS